MIQGNLFTGGVTKIKSKIGEIYRRETSIEAYHDLVRTGKLGKVQESVLKILKEFGPGTAKELEVRSHSYGLWKRLSELRDLGHAEEQGKVHCSITGKKAILWRAV